MRPTRKHKYEEVRWSLSFHPRSSLRGCLCFSLSHRRCSQSCSYHDYALHCSHDMNVAWRHRVVAWERAMYQYHVNGTDTVGRSVDAHGPVDHASVGLAQARPNYGSILKLHRKFIITVASTHAQ